MGNGSLVAMVCVGGVRAPKNWSIPGLNDSKKLSPARREAMRAKLQEAISNNDISFHMAERSHTIIDQYGIAPAMQDAYLEVFRKLYQPGDLIVVDGDLKFAGMEDYRLLFLPKADGIVPHVMAASILTKTYRDGEMKKLHQLYPQYGWDHNMGYARPDHLQAIQEHGPCELHRFSYAPMRKMKLTDPKQLKIPGT